MSQVVKSKIEQFTRLLFVNSVSIWNNSVLLVEYPKSGGTWLGQLISSALEIPFPRNQMPILQKSFYHSHYLPKWLITRNKPIVFLVRDGRDVLISKYFHQLIWNEKNKLNPKDVVYHRSKVPFENYDNINENLFDFIRYDFEHRPSKFQQFTYMGNWCEYNQAWLKEMQNNNNIHLVKYEDLLSDSFSTLDLLLKQAFKLELSKSKLNRIIEKYSFHKQTNRRSGEESVSSFLRKGISGDWKNYFGNKEKELYKKYAAKLLVELNYENDDNW